jgi:murein lipoprotein
LVSDGGDEFATNQSAARLLFVLAPLMLAGCASTGDLDAVRADSQSAVATADQSKSEAQQALSTAQQALKAGQLAEANASTATEDANRMYQRELRK